MTVKLGKPAAVVETVEWTDRGQATDNEADCPINPGGGGAARPTAAPTTTSTGSW